MLIQVLVPEFNQKAIVLICRLFKRIAQQTPNNSDPETASGGLIQIAIHRFVLVAVGPVQLVIRQGV